MFTNTIGIDLYKIRIQSDTPIVLEWLDDFYIHSGCIEKLEACENPDYEIIFQKAEKIDVHVPVHAREAIFCKTKDPRFRSYGTRWEEKGDVHVFSHQLGMYMLCADNEQKMSLWYNEIFYMEDMANYNVNQFLDAILQSIFYRLHEKNNGCLFHAACIENHAGRGILLAGDTASGKTSALLGLAVTHNWRVSAWGRTIIRECNGNLYGHGFPSYENIRLLTMQALNLPCDKAINPYDPANALSRVTFIPVDNPARFERIQNVPLILVCFLEFDPQCRKIEINRTGNEELHHEFEKTCLSPYDETYIDWLPFADQEHIANCFVVRKGIIGRLLEMDCYKIVHNGNIHLLSDAIMNLLPMQRTEGKYLQTPFQACSGNIQRKCNE